MWKAKHWWFYSKSSKYFGEKKVVYGEEGGRKPGKIDMEGCVGGVVVVVVMVWDS